MTASRGISFPHAAGLLNCGVGQPCKRLVSSGCMMIRFTCTKCGKSYRVPEEFAGRRTKCRTCGEALRIPDAAEKVSARKAPGVAEISPTPTLAKKTCSDCGKPVELFAHVCPACGSGSLVSHIPVEETQAVVEKQVAARGLVDRGMALILEKRYTEAMEALGKAMTINPHNANAYGNAGGAFFEQGAFEAAIPMFEKALALDPGLEGIREALASARVQAKLQEQGRQEAAVQHKTARETATATCWFCERRPSDSNCYVEVAGYQSVNGDIRICRPRVPRCADCAQVHRKASRLWLQYGCIGLPLGLVLVIACVTLSMNLFREDHFKAVGFLSIFLLAFVPISGKIAVNRLLSEHGTKGQSDPGIRERSLAAFAAGTLQEAQIDATALQAEALSAQAKRAEVLAAAEALFLRIRNPQLTGDEYVDSCFHMNFTTEKPEDRVWQKFADLRDVLDLKNSGQTQRALVLAEAALQRYSDYDILYVWIADLRAEEKQAGEPQKTYLEGLGKCLRKEKLCANLAMEAFAAEDLAEAVRWWICSCVAQLHGGKAANQYPFINLAYVAEGMGLRDAQARLLEWADAIEPLQTRFDANGANLRYRLAATQGNPSIARAVTTLCDFSPYSEEMERQRPGPPGGTQPGEFRQEAKRQAAEFEKWLDEEERKDSQI